MLFACDFEALFFTSLQQILPMSEYLHGYTKQEYERLIHQAEFLKAEVYNNLSIPSEGLLLELGCGVGAQTRILLEKYPQLNIIAVDRSEEAIETAKLGMKQEYLSRVEFVCSDLSDFVSPQPADAAFYCWMLEHAENPVALLKQASKSLKPAARVFVTEVQNNSLQVYPQNENLERYWAAYNKMQLDYKGDPFIGVKLSAYLQDAGFKNLSIEPRMFIYNHHNKLALQAICEYWWRLLNSASDELISRAYIDAETRDLSREHLLNLHLNENATFSYTFVQAKAEY
jgi:ubiquinone/menaquinone biosynthesis C-methylase UbiE